MKTHPIGKFSIDRRHFDGDGWREWQDFFAHFVVVQAEYQFDNDAILYTALSDHYFKPVPCDCRAPLYSITLTRRESQPPEFKVWPENMPEPVAVTPNAKAAAHALAGRLWDERKLAAGWDKNSDEALLAFVIENKQLPN